MKITSIGFVVLLLADRPANAQGVDLFGGYQILQNSFLNLCSSLCRPSLPLGWTIDAASHHIAGQVSGSYGSQDVGDFTTTDHFHTFFGGARFGPKKRIAPFGEVLGGLLRRHSEVVIPGSPRRSDTGKQFALVLGGGMNMSVSEHVTVRVVGDWLHGYQHDAFNQQKLLDPQNVYMPPTNAFRFQTGVVVHLR